MFVSGLGALSPWAAHCARLGSNSLQYLFETAMMINSDYMRLSIATTSVGSESMLLELIQGCNKEAIRLGLIVMRGRP